jgi:hypothetical protein
MDDNALHAACVRVETIALLVLAAESDDREEIAMWLMPRYADSLSTLRDEVTRYGMRLGAGDPAIATERKTLFRLIRRAETLVVGATKIDP